MYENEFFEMSIPYNEEWAVQSTEQMNELVAAGTDLLSGEDDNLKAAIEASKVNTAYLFSLFKYDVGTSTQFNPSFLSLAENVKNFPDLADGGDYLSHTKNLLQQSQVTYTYDKDIYPITIDGVEFHAMELSVEVMGNKITQEYMCTLKNDFALAFVISHSNDEERAELHEILSQIEM